MTFPLGFRPTYIGTQVFFLIRYKIDYNLHFHFFSPIYYFCRAFHIRRLHFSLQSKGRCEVWSRQKDLMLCYMTNHCPNSVFTHMPSIYTNLSEQKKAFTREKSSIPTGLVSNVNMADVFIVLGHQMADVTSCENALYLAAQPKCKENGFHFLFFSCFFFNRGKIHGVYSTCLTIEQVDNISS